MAEALFGQLDRRELREAVLSGLQGRELEFLRRIHRLRITNQETPEGFDAMVRTLSRCITKEAPHAIIAEPCPDPP
jgi:hypothetical protein